MSFVIDPIINAINNFINFIQSIPKAITDFATMVYNAIVNLPNAIYNFGQWLWNGVLWVAKIISEIPTRIFNAVVDAFNNLFSNVETYFNNLRNSINSFITSLAIRARTKLKQILISNLTIYATWKYAEVQIKKGSLGGIIKIPLITLGTYFISYIIAEAVDQLIPVPSTTNYEFIPPITLPKVEIPSVSPIEVPTPEAPKPLPYVGIGIYQPLDIPIYIRTTPNAFLSPTLSLTPPINSKLECRLEPYTGLSPEISTSVEASYQPPLAANLTVNASVEASLS